MSGEVRITCECGATVSGSDEAEVLAAAHEHVRRDHPDLIGRFTDDDFRRMMQAG